MSILVRIVVNALALWAATLIPGIELTDSTTTDKIVTLLLVGAIFGVINAVIKPIIKLLGCGLYLLTLGLIAFIVNALLFMLGGWVSEQFGLGFEVEGFGPAFFGAIVMGIVSFGITVVLPDNLKR
ncbi:MAG TPA: phage holin family protein [Actinopolymorphaceae bacterium]